MSYLKPLRRGTQTRLICISIMVSQSDRVALGKLNGLDVSDFYSYGVLELVDKTLSSLHTKIVKKAWKDAYSILEALIMFASFEGIWTRRFPSILRRRHRH